MSRLRLSETVVFDLDGPLVDDSADQVRAWDTALRSVGVGVPLWRLHAMLAVGGDRLVEETAGDEVEARCGDRVREAWRAEMARTRPHQRVRPEAPGILRALLDAGVHVVVTSACEPAHVEHHLRALGVLQDVHHWCGTGGVSGAWAPSERLRAALSEAPSGAVVHVGDSPWHAVAGSASGVPTYTVTSGGFTEDELVEAGSAACFSSLRSLGDHLLGRVPAALGA